MKIVNLHCAQLGLSIPQSLIDRIDLVRGDVTRSRFIWRMLENNLNVKVNVDAVTKDESLLGGLNSSNVKQQSTESPESNNYGCKQ